MTSFFIPVKTVSEANQRCHWAVRAKRAKNQKTMVFLHMSPLMEWGTRGALQCQKSIRIKLTRMGGRKMDSDNLAGSMKAVRDGIARALEMDDGDERLTWEYAQSKGEMGVMVEIR